MESRCIHIRGVNHVSRTNRERLRDSIGYWTINSFLRPEVHIHYTTFRSTYPWEERDYLFQAGIVGGSIFLQRKPDSCPFDVGGHVRAVELLSIISHHQLGHIWQGHE